MKFRTSTLDEEVEAIFSVIQYSPNNWSPEKIKKTFKINIDLNLINLIKETTLDKIKSKLKEIFSKKYEEEQSKINIRDISKKWNEKKIEILSKLKNIIEHKIEEEEITCVLLCLVDNGLYKVDEKQIEVFYDSKDFLFLMTHELFHILYWQVWKELFNETKIKNKKSWLLSEIIDYLVLDNNEIKNLWQNKQQPFFEKEIIWPKIFNAWKIRENFDSFLIEAKKIID